MGSRLPFQPQKAWASFQLTWTTGKFSRSRIPEPGPAGWAVGGQGNARSVDNLLGEMEEIKMKGRQKKKRTHLSPKHPLYGQPPWSRLKVRNNQVQIASYNQVNAHVNTLTEATFLYFDSFFSKPQNLNPLCDFALQLIWHKVLKHKTPTKRLGFCFVFLVPHKLPVVQMRRNLYGRTHSIYVFKHIAGPIRCLLYFTWNQNLWQGTCRF